MDLKEYIRIIRENRKVFVAVVAVAVAGSFFVVSAKPVTYSTSLAFNITRTGTQQTPDYKYDDFYRLQADEKFADTVVQWLKDPRVVSNIYAAAGLDTSAFSLRQLQKSFGAEKLSSQFVSVTFAARSVDSAKKISVAIKDTVSQNTAALNKEQNESAWFETAAQDPVIVRDRISPLILFVVSLLVGLFLAFWTVLIIHYLK